MTAAPQPRLIVDFDRPGSPLESTQTRCDYLMIAEDHSGSHWIIVIELKKGRLDAGDVAR